MKILMAIFILLPFLLVFASEQSVTTEPSKSMIVKDNDHWFAVDKLKHFTASALIAGAGYYRMKYKENSTDTEAQWGGFGISLSFGLGKELMDVKDLRPFSIKDLVADIIGIFFGLWVLSW